jgi:hypothetical protein
VGASASLVRQRHGPGSSGIRIVEILIETK